MYRVRTDEAGVRAQRPPGKGRPLNTKLLRQIQLRMAAEGLIDAPFLPDDDLWTVTEDLIESYRARGFKLDDPFDPADRRMQDFIDGECRRMGVSEPPQLPWPTLRLDRAGLARELALPLNGNEFHNEVLESYRLTNGVLHNPRSDRRTSHGGFHVVAGTLPVPGDKIEVPFRVFVRMLRIALTPSDELSILPLTSDWDRPVKSFVSLLLRPVVCPAIPGRQPAKTLETRFHAPGGMVANLDFVESIFGNGGLPRIPEYDAALDTDHWTGHSGCVILAPQLMGRHKRALGLPHWDDATERQRRDGVAWRDDDEIYNDGHAFKITHRSASGQVITLISDNYFGYCKKEVKTQISFSANLYGLAEEEHAGGALAFPSFHLGSFADLTHRRELQGYTFGEAQDLLGDAFLPQSEGHGRDRNHPAIVYVPEHTRFSVREQRLVFTLGGNETELPLRPGEIYVHPAGYKMQLERDRRGHHWYLVGTQAEGTFCHKPCTVSGGGKSEISKRLDDAVLYGPVFVDDLQRDLDLVEDLVRRDYSDRMRPDRRADYSGRPSRPVLSDRRSLSSVIKMFTPSENFTDEYNAWLSSFPDRIWPIVFLLKRFYKQDWGNDWRRMFSVDAINGVAGHRLKYRNRDVVSTYLRVGYDVDGNWRIYKLRQDFKPAAKVQTEDDISTSVVVPRHWLNNLCTASDEPSQKLVINVETRLFQRPDEAIHRGIDRQTEFDMAAPGLFCSNFQPLTPDEAREETEDLLLFDQYTEPMRRHLLAGADQGDAWVVASARPRIVDGAPTRNPRYLQLRPDYQRPIEPYLAQLGARLRRRVPAGESVPFPVNAVLTGRRNNPPDLERGIQPLCVFGPIHYQELPELFMDFIASLTGKSPSTTGAGTEGALTKGPFNMLRATTDLNNALVGYLLTGHGVFSSAAGYVGPYHRVDHDISLLVPEIWSRLAPEHRQPEFLIDHGYLERVQDRMINGREVKASRLGWRITATFVRDAMQSIFDHPDRVFTSSMLHPEEQDLEIFAAGVDNIVEAQRRVAQQYLDDGAIEEAAPPLRALLHIMAEGSYEGWDEHHLEFRALFTREALLASDWYNERLRTLQRRERTLWTRHVASLEDFRSRYPEVDARPQLDLAGRLSRASARLEHVSRPEYVEEIVGTLGADPLGGRD